MGKIQLSKIWRVGIQANRGAIRPIFYDTCQEILQLIIVFYGFFDPKKKVFFLFYVLPLYFFSC